ncbi:MAG: PAS domain-containing protein [Bacteroidales bacterium]|nr:PAS domain-containing protein [Bacteroidales bacterium]
MNKVIGILFVDDVQEDVDSAINAISKSGIKFTHTVVRTKSDFTEAMISVVPDIIISEYVLAQFEWTITLSLRNEISPYTPIIVLTDAVTESTALDCLKTGINYYIRKSNLSNLPQAIKALLLKRDKLLSGLDEYTALRYTELKHKFLSCVLNDTTSAIISVDINDNVVLWNKAAELLFGWSCREVIGFPMEQVVSHEFFDIVEKKTMNHHYRSEQWEGEVYVRNKTGERVHLFCTVAGVKDEEGLNIGQTYRYQRFSDRLKYEAKEDGQIVNENIPAEKDFTVYGSAGGSLKESEQIADNLMRLDLAVKSAKMGLTSYDVKKRKRYFDKQAFHLLGIDSASFNGTDEEYFERIHPGDREEVKSLVHLSLSKVRDYEAEYRILWNDGSLHYIVSRARLITDDENKPVRLNGLIWDVTDQKLLEINLRENLRKTNSIINNLNGVVFRRRLDDEMTMEYISHGMKTLTGYPSWDFLLNRVRSFNSLIVKEDKEKIKIEIKNAVEGETFYSVEYRIKPLKGKQRWMLERGHGIYTGKNRLAVEGFITEITDRKNIESKLNKSLNQLQQLNQYLQIIREKERVAISRELHDDLGQALTAIKIDLGSLKHILSNTEEAKNKIEKITALVCETIRTVQNLTAQLRPQIIDDLGVEAAIEWYTKDFSERTGIKIHLILEPVLNMPADISLIIFRILQESLTNIARHSKATNAEIKFRVHEKSWILNVRDNGVGISENDKISKKSFGLISMRERAKCFGGELEIKTPGEGGTIVSLRIPIKEGKSRENFNL